MGSRKPLNPIWSRLLAFFWNFFRDRQTLIDPNNNLRGGFEGSVIFTYSNLHCRVHQRGNKLICQYWWSLTKKAKHFRGKQGKYVWCKKSCACGLKAWLSLSLWINFSPFLRFLYATCLWVFLVTLSWFETCRAANAAQVRTCIKQSKKYLINKMWISLDYKRNIHAGNVCKYDFLKKPIFNVEIIWKKLN